MTASPDPRLLQPPVASGDGGTPYDAFISYSHGADTRTAALLQEAMQLLGKRIYQRRALRVFRDRTNLSAAPGLWESVAQALASSRWLIFLASRSAASSEWASRELSWWREHRDSDSVLIVLTDGEIVWERGREADWTATTALPAAARGWFREEPLWVDLRWLRDAEDVSRRDPRLQDAAATLAAAVHGRSKDDLVGADMRNQRRLRRMTIGALAALLVLALSAAVGAVVAVQARDAARTQALVAESRALSASALTVAPDRLDTAALMAERGVREYPSPDNRAALLTVLTASPTLKGFLPAGSGQITAVVPLNGGGAAVGRDDGSAELAWAGRSGATTVTPSGAAVTALAVTPSRSDVLVGRSNGVLTSVNMASGRSSWSSTVSGAISDVHLSPDGKTIAVLTQAGIALYDAASGARRAAATAPLDTDASARATFIDDATVLVETYTGSTQAWAVGPGLRTLWARGQSAPANGYSASFSPSGRYYAFHKYGVTLVDVARDATSAWTPQVPSGSGEVAVDDSGGRVAVVQDDGEVLVVSKASATGGADGRLTLNGFSGIRRLAFSPDGRHLVVTGAADAAVFDLGASPRLASLSGARVDDVPCNACPVAVSTSRRSFLAYTTSAGVVCWDMRSGSERFRDSSTAFSLAFTPSGSRLVAADEGELRVWDASAGCPSGKPRTVPLTGLSVEALTPVDEDRVVVLDPQVVALVALRDGAVLRRYAHADESGPGALVSSAVSSDGKRLVVATADGIVRWFDVESGHPEGQATVSVATYAVTLLPRPASPDVIVQGPTSVDEWAPDGRRVRHFDGSVRALVLSADSTLLVGLRADDSLLVWDAATGARLGELPSLTPTLTGQGLNPEHHTGIAADESGVWVLPAGRTGVHWSLDWRAWIPQACEIANRSLTRDEWSRFVGTDPPEHLECGRGSSG